MMPIDIEITKIKKLKNFIVREVCLSLNLELNPANTSAIEEDSNILRCPEIAPLYTVCGVPMVGFITFNLEIF